jgi:hypothetical protein
MNDPPLSPPPNRDLVRHESIPDAVKTDGVGCCPTPRFPASALIKRAGATDFATPFVQPRLSIRGSNRIATMEFGCMTAPLASMMPKRSASLSAGNADLRSTSGN